MSVRNEFSKKFSDLISQSEHTQAQIAKYMGVSAPTITDWKTGKKMPRIDKIARLASFFQVSPKYFMGNDEQEQTPTSKYTWLHGLVEDVLQEEPAVLAVLESSAPYVAGSVGGAAKDVLRSSLRLVTDSMASYDASPGVPIRGGNEYTKNNST